MMTRQEMIDEAVRRVFKKHPILREAAKTASPEYWSNGTWFRQEVITQFNWVVQGR